MPVPYFLVTFTVPQELRPLFAAHPEAMHAALFRESAATLQQVAAERRLLGAELGLVGVLAVIGGFFWLIRRIVNIGRQAIALDRVFAGLMAQGVAIWFAGQAFINMGVNLGVLPTKGLTLPLMSFGGSGILMNLIALAMVLRVDIENRALMRGGRA